MKAWMPNKLSRIADIGDILTLGKFLMPGSPAPEKEPFFGFFHEDDPLQVVALRNGTEALVSCSLSAAFHLQQAIYLVYLIDPETKRKIKDGRFVFFPDTDREAVVEKGDFPPGLTIQVLSDGIV